MAPTRLINTQNLAFETKFAPIRRGDSEFPRFAIISHRWEDQEISYQEFLYFTSPQSDRNNTVARILGLDLSKENGTGFAKVKSACSVARARGYEWLWIDTCCINKDSSAELSEAINSMYEWYREAAECLVYLSTVTAGEVDFRNDDNEFWKSEWWRRGWTLQELIAPQDLSFWDHHWQYLISRHELDLAIARKTGIPSDCLGDEYRIQTTSIATRMSWARSRTTSRLEDTAYSLLGIFNINMPLLYGEGTRAFQRLQEAIIARSNDETIFAVNNDSGLLATRPSDFSPLPVVRWDLSTETRNRTFSVVQAGIRMRISYLVMGNYVWAVAFNCKHTSLGRPFIRLFDVVQRNPGLQQFRTARLSARGHPDEVDILQQAYNRIADSISKKKNAYKHEEAIFLTEEIPVWRAQVY